MIVFRSQQRVAADDGSKLPAAAPSQVVFARDIQPLFREHCVKCHGPDKSRSDLRLDSKSAAMKGGSNFSPAIIPGQSEQSPIVRVVAGLVDGMQMPPAGEQPLTADQIGLIRAWIDQGAKWSEASESNSADHHWSFQPLSRPRPPQVSLEHVAAIGNPLDAFIVAKVEDGNSQSDSETKITLHPAVEASRVILIRRATLDLIGLPPSPDEVQEFLVSPHPDAFERLVDRLLSSPHFGERWARHWLDVVRFAESDGFETNQPRPTAWPYRDYVIGAINDDRSFQRFIFEQLAGDTAGIDEATGFLVAGAADRVKSPDPGLTAQQRADELHDMVSTTSSAFFGLTVGCARCHNHKFDPIPQTDYYSLKAVFSGVQHGERPLKPADFEQREQAAQIVRRELEAVEQKLSEYEPYAFVVDVGDVDQVSDSSLAANDWTLLIEADDRHSALDSAANTTAVVPQFGFESYRRGTERGQLKDPGNATRFPTLGLRFMQWHNVSNIDVLTWNPKARGRWRIWISWGCGRDTNAAAAIYLLDADGDLTTRDDQREIARVDQRRFADGSGGGENQSLWSGFFDAGSHVLTPTTKLVLRAGPSTAVVTADLICLQREQATTVHAGLPQLRCSVQRQANVERFPPVRARYLKFVVDATSGGEPCLDELEVFRASRSGQQNVALASFGTRATSSSNLPGHEIHQLRFLNDGRYGNSASWISNESGRGWVQLEFPEPVEIDRVLWSRDRPDDGNYQDRIPTKYRIAAGLTQDSMRIVASSDDRIPFDRKWISIPTVVALTESDHQAAEALVAQREAIKQRLQSLTTVPKLYAGRFVAPEPTFRFHRGDPLQPKESIAPAGLSFFASTWRAAENAAEADRRVGLANWITGSDHPLTTRVMVNRLWHFHFGQGIVATPSDFGRNGARPSHPALLDWLANEAIAGNSPKRLHRLIVTSGTYRQSSDAHEAGLLRDAGTRVLWRYPPHRLEAESIRDAILAVCGNLDDRMYGVGFDLFEPNTNYVKVYQSKRTFGPGEWRRMVYQAKPRMQLDEVFGQFDCPDAGQITPKRTSSITALQALGLLNSQFVMQQSALFANRLRTESGAGSANQVRRAFLLAFHREPTDEESLMGVNLVRDHGLEAFARAILNANEFLFVF